MRGVVIKWFQDRGFGFIRPVDPGTADVFLHARELARCGLGEPIVGAPLEFEIDSDGRGRLRAKRISAAPLAQLSEGDG